MLRRYWRFIVAVLCGKLHQLEDPEDLLLLVPRELKEIHLRNRERAVQAITPKRHLQQMADDTQKRVADLQSEADRALDDGDQMEAHQLLEEKQRYEQALAATRESLEQADQAVEEVKAALRREQERLHRATGWTPPIFPVGRNSPESIAIMTLSVLVGAALIALLRMSARW